MKSLVDELPAAQKPRILVAPPAHSYTSGYEAIELAETAGLHLDPWQKFAVLIICAEYKLNAWAAFEVALLVARQNGKGGIIEARELAGLFLFGERLIIHSAHRFETSGEAFLRMMTLIEGCPDLDRRVKRVNRSHGEEGIELRTGQRIKYKTRSGAGGRGLSGKLVVLDEAMYLTAAMMSALLFTLSAQDYPQLLYAGSAVDQLEHVHGVVLTRIRNRGLAGNDPSLAYLEWSPAVTMAQVVAGEVDLTDPALIEAANPAVDIRISREHIANEFRTIPKREYAIERLSIGDWPEVGDEPGWEVISQAELSRCLDPHSVPLDPVVIGVSMEPNRSHLVIAVAAYRSDARVHGEVVDERAGTSGAVDRLVELITTWDPDRVVIDSADAAATLGVELRKRELDPWMLTTREFATACGGLYDDVTQDNFRYRGDSAINSAVQYAETRTVGGAWVWGRPEGYAAALVAVTVARHGLVATPQPVVVATPQLAEDQDVERDAAMLQRTGF